KAMNIHVFHGDAVDLWRTVVDSGRFARLHPVVMAISIAVVIAIGGKRGQNAIHADAAHGYAADRSAPPAPRLYPQAAVGADHLAILYADVMHAAGHFRTYHQSAMTPFHQAMADLDIARFAQMVGLPMGATFASLDGDAIIPDRKADTFDTDTGAAFRIEAVGIGAVMRSLDRQPGRNEIPATLR